MPMPARLYELIWKRAVASQMESAELERTTVDVVSADKQDHAARHRHGHAVRRLPHALSGRPGRRGRRRRLADCRKRRRRRRHQGREGQAGAAFHRAAAALFRSQPGAASWKSSASAGLRPMPRSFRCCATAPMCGWTAAASFPRTRAASSPPSCNNFFHRYVEYDFTADLEEKLDEVSDGKLDWKQLLRDFWKDFSAAVGETKDLKISQVIDELDRGARPAHLPAERGRRRSAQMPHLRERAAEPEARAVSAPSSAAPIIRNAASPASSAQKPGEGDAGPRELGDVPRHRRESHAALRPLRALCAARRRREAQARRPAQGHRSRRMSISNWR